MRSGGFGPEPVSWSEIKAWAEMTDTMIEPWEAKAIMDASRAYVRQLGRTGLREVPPVNDWDIEKAQRFFGVIMRNQRSKRVK